MFDDKTLAWFDRNNIRRPEHISHGTTPDDLENRMRRLKLHSWRLEGNKLIGMTEMGPFVQTIPTTHILVGTGDDGLPKFQRVQMS